jgi:hypothetical protein
MSVETPIVTSTPVLNVVDQKKVEVKADDKATTPPVQVAEDKKEDPQSQESFSKRFSALNRERKALDKEKADLQKRMASIEAKASKVKEWEDKEKTIKESKNPIAALQAFGYSYEDAANYLLNDQKPTPDLMIKSVEEKLAEMQRKLEEKDKEALEHQKKLLETQSNQENIKAIGAIKSHLESKPEFDALVALGMEDDIFRKINDHYHAEETQGEVLQIDDVAKEMLEQVEKMLGLVTKTTLFKTKFQGATTHEKKEPPKTLNNSLYSQTTPADKKIQKTDEERIKNALALLSK